MELELNWIVSNGIEISSVELELKDSVEFFQLWMLLPFKFMSFEAEMQFLWTNARTRLTELSTTLSFAAAQKMTSSVHQEEIMKWKIIKLCRSVGRAFLV